MASTTGHSGHNGARLFECQICGQSSRLRRSAPICRQHEYATRTELLPDDLMSSVMAQLVGNFEIYQANNPAGHMTYAEFTALMAGASKYRVPDMLIDMIINPDQILELRVKLIDKITILIWECLSHSQAGPVSNAFLKNNSIISGKEQGNLVLMLVMLSVYSV